MQDGPSIIADRQLWIFIESAILRTILVDIPPCMIDNLSIRRCRAMLYEMLILATNASYIMIFSKVGVGNQNSSIRKYEIDVSPESDGHKADIRRYEIRELLGGCHLRGALDIFCGDRIVFLITSPFF
jgi:hypothetical protein